MMTAECADSPVHNGATSKRTVMPAKAGIQYSQIIAWARLTGLLLLIILFPVRSL
jgi:hypothetical protein